MGSMWVDQAQRALMRLHPELDSQLKTNFQDVPFLLVSRKNCFSPLMPFHNPLFASIVKDQNGLGIQLHAFNGQTMDSECVPELIQSQLLARLSNQLLCPGVSLEYVHTSQYEHGLIECYSHSQILRHKQCSLAIAPDKEECDTCQSLLPTKVEEQVKSEEEEEQPTPMIDLDGEPFDIVTESEPDEPLNDEPLKRKRSKATIQTHPCTNCQMKYASTSALDNHACIGSRPRSCPICLIRVKLSCKYDMHLKIHANRFDLQQSVPCPKCKANVPKLEMTSHYHMHHDPNRSCCVECFKIVSNEKMYNHFHGSHNQAKDKLCTLCGKSFRDRPMLSVHMAVTHNEGVEEAVCDFCGRSYPHRYLMLKHINMVHKGKTGPQPCHICGKVCATLPKLSKHLKLHTKFRCNLCEDYLNGKVEAVFRHLKEIHHVEPTDDKVTKLENTDIASRGRNKRATKKEMMKRKSDHVSA